jgi:hypothetical protein
LKKKGQYAQAKPLYLDALKIVEEVYGEVRRLSQNWPSTPAPPLVEILMLAVG